MAHGQSNDLQDDLEAGEFYASAFNNVTDKRGPRPPPQKEPTLPLPSIPVAPRARRQPLTAPLVLTSYSRRRRYKGRLFGLRNNERKQFHAATAVKPTARTYDYEQRYPEDAYGAEAFPEARVWRVYNDEADIFDLERIEAWRDALDVLLVFIGLFSAIVTTFVVQSSQTLQPDYVQMTAILTWELLQAIANSTSIIPTPISINHLDPRIAPATASPDSILVNTLWFTSLSVSLSAGLIAVLVKQWLYRYTTSISASTSRERARIRQFRDDGLQRYRIALIIDLLPVGLHAALALFMAGLAISLFPLHTTMFRIVLGITGASFGLYLVSAFLPLIDPQCPYQSPITSYLYLLLKYPLVLVFHRASWLGRYYVHQWRASPWLGRGLTEDPYAPANPPLYTPPPPSLVQEEKLAVVHTSPQLDVNGVAWLYQTSSNSSVRSIALEAIGGLAPSNADPRRIYEIIDSDLYNAVWQASDHDSATLEPLPGMEQKHDRLLRALCVGDRGKIPKRLHTLPPAAKLRASETDSRTILSSGILPILRGPGYSDGLTVFFQPGGMCGTLLPLTIWAALLRLAKRHDPENSVVTLSIVYAGLFSSRVAQDAIDVEPADFATALRSPFIRSLGLAYVGLSNVDNETEKVLALTHSSLTSLRSNTQSHLVTPHLSTLMESLATQTNRSNLSSTCARLTRDILIDFLQSRYLNLVSWEAISHATNALSRTYPTPPMIGPILRQFRRRKHPTSEDMKWIHWVMEDLEEIMEYCVDSWIPNGLAKALFGSLKDLDMLPRVTRSKQPESLLSVFWSVSMCRKIVKGTAQHFHSRGEGWLDEWLVYIHTRERLLFLCRQLMSLDALEDLCQIQPWNPHWPAVLHTLICLYGEQGFLLLVPGGDGKPSTDGQGFSNGLVLIKDILIQYHDLSNPMFDLP